MEIICEAMFCIVMLQIVLISEDQQRTSLVISATCLNGFIMLHNFIWQWDVQLLEKFQQSSLVCQQRMGKQLVQGKRKNNNYLQLGLITQFFTLIYVKFYITHEQSIIVIIINITSHKLGLFADQFRYLIGHSVLWCPLSL